MSLMAELSMYPEMQGVVLNQGEEIVAKRAAIGGGWYYMSNQGGVFAVGGAKSAGSYLGLAPEQRQGERDFVDMQVNPDGTYTLIALTRGANQRQEYRFGTPSAAPGTTAPQNPLATPPALPTAPAPTPASDAAREAVEQQIKSSSAIVSETLNRYGLGSLTDWALEQIRQGASVEQTLQSLRQRPEYQQRFAGMETRRANGLAPVSEAEYIGMESAVADYFSRAGLDRAQWGDPQYLAKVIGANVNVSQFAQRVSEAYVLVNEQEDIRSFMMETLGGNTDQFLLGTLLDPTRSEVELDRLVRTARVGGIGRRQGVGVSVGLADELARRGVSDAEAQRGFGQVANDAAILTEMEGEVALGEEDSIAANFDLDNGARARRLLSDRVTSRRARGRGRTIGDLQTGLIGLGRADS